MRLGHLVMCMDSIASSDTRETAPGRVRFGLMNNETIKVCVLGATFDTGNMGISMLAAGTIRCVLHRFPLAQISFLDYARKGYQFRFLFEKRQIPIHFVNIRFSKKVYLVNNIALLVLLTCMYRLFPFKRFGQRLFSTNTCVKQILESELVFSMAYGDSFSDIYGMGRLLYIALPQMLALLAGKRLILLPQTIGPFKSRAAKALARCILKRAELVYSRDYAGLKTTQVLLGLEDNNNKLQFCYDLAFDVDPVQPERIDIEGLPAIRSENVCLVGFNVSGLLLMGGYTQNNMFGLKVAYETIVHTLIEFLIKEKSAMVLLIPHVFGPPEDPEGDVRACETIFESLSARFKGRIGVVRGSYDYNEIKYVIGECDFFIGARMHACIGALSQNIPTMPIAYSDKFAGMMQTIGCEDLVVDPRRMDEKEIVEILNRIYENRITVRSELEKKLPLVKQTIHNALSNVDVHRL